MSFRLKTILWITVIQIFFLTAIVWSSINYLKESNTKSLLDQADDGSDLFISTIKDAVFSFDLASLNDAANELLTNEKILYVRIYDHEKLIIEGGKKINQNRPFYADKKTSFPEDGIYDISKPIIESGYTYGHIEMGINTKEIQSKFEYSSYTILLIAGAELLISVLFSYALGFYLTKQLTSLHKASEAIKNGDIGYQMTVHGTDELATVANSFNLMSRQIQQSINTQKQQYNIIHSRVSLLTSLLEEMPFGILLGDHLSQKSVFINTTLCKLIGLKESEKDRIIDSTTSETMKLIRKNFRKPENLESYLKKSLSSVKNTSSENWSLVNNKNIKVDTLNIKINNELSLFYLWIFQDDSGTKINQRIIRQRSNELSSLFNLIPDGIVLFNKDGKIINISDGFTKVTGLPIDDIIGRSIKWIDDCIRKKLKKGQSISEIDYEKSRKTLTDSFSILHNDSVIHLERIVIFDNSDPLFGGVIYYRDISQQKKIELMKSEFLSTAAHELRTPMANIYGYSELLLNTDFDFELRSEFTKVIHKQCERLVIILDDLLDLAKIEANGRGILNYETKNLDQLLHECVKLFSSEEHLCNFELNIKKTQPLLCDKNKIAQAINNIISNAKKYSPNNSIISISLHEIKNEEINGAEIIFQDEGIGMTLDQLSRVYERFYRADVSGSIPGTGLGLSIVKEIIVLHNGKINIQSELHKGTKVTIWLPYSQPAQRQPKPVV